MTASILNLSFLPDSAANTNRPLVDRVKKYDGPMEFDPNNEAWSEGAIAKQVLTDYSNNPKTPSSLDELFDAFTLGLVPDLNNPDQFKAFQAYLFIRFGNPSTSLPENHLERIARIQKEHPELQAENFREMVVRRVVYEYQDTKELKKFISQNLQAIGDHRGKYLEIDKKMKTYLKLQIKVSKEGGGKEKINVFPDEKAFKEFFDNDILEKISRVDLQSDVKYLELIDHIQNKLKENPDRYKKTKPAFDQMIVDLVHLHSFDQPYIEDTLKNGKPQKKLKAFDQGLGRRDTLAQELGYDTFDDLLKKLNKTAPKGFADSRTMANNFKAARDSVNHTKKIVEGNFKEYRVRNLMLPEKPLRSCLGDTDCSSRTYFDRAFQKNYHYFTATNADGLSSGHVTLVTGTTTDSSGKSIKTAFVDKIQNVDNDDLPHFLEAVRLSMKEKGFQVEIPEDLGDHNGISNDQSTRNFIENDLIGFKNNSKLSGTFKPSEPISFAQKQGFSLAYGNPRTKRLLPLRMKKSTKILPGRQRSSWSTTKVNFAEIVSKIKDLKHGSDLDKKRYIHLIPSFRRMGTDLDSSYESVLSKWVRSRKISSNLRNTILTHFLLTDKKRLLRLTKNMSQKEKNTLLQNWLQSPRTRDLANSSREMLSFAKGNSKLLDRMSQKFDIDHINRHLSQNLAAWDKEEHSLFKEMIEHIKRRTGSKWKKDLDISLATDLLNIQSRYLKKQNRRKPFSKSTRKASSKMITDAIQSQNISPKRAAKLIIGIQHQADGSMLGYKIIENFPLKYKQEFAKYNLLYGGLNIMEQDIKWLNFDDPQTIDIVRNKKMNLSRSYESRQDFMSTIFNQKPEVFIKHFSEYPFEYFQHAESIRSFQLISDSRVKARFLNNSPSNQMLYSILDRIQQRPMPPLKEIEKRQFTILVDILQTQGDSYIVSSLVKNNPVLKNHLLAILKQDPFRFDKFIRDVLKTWLPIDSSVVDSRKWALSSKRKINRAKKNHTSMRNTLVDALKADPTFRKEVFYNYIAEMSLPAFIGDLKYLPWDENITFDRELLSGMGKDEIKKTNQFKKTFNQNHDRPVNSPLDIKSDARYESDREVERKNKSKKWQKQRRAWVDLQLSKKAPESLLESLSEGFLKEHHPNQLITEIKNSKYNWFLGEKAIGIQSLLRKWNTEGFRATPRLFQKGIKKIAASPIVEDSLAYKIVNYASNHDAGPVQKFAVKRLMNLTPEDNIDDVVYISENFKNNKEVIKKLKPIHRRRIIDDINKGKHVNQSIAFYPWDLNDPQDRSLLRKLHKKAPKTSRQYKNELRDYYDALPEEVKKEFKIDRNNTIDDLKEIESILDTRIKNKVKSLYLKEKMAAGLEDAHQVLFEKSPEDFVRFFGKKHFAPPLFEIQIGKDTTYYPEWILPFVQRTSSKTYKLNAIDRKIARLYSQHFLGYLFLLSRNKETVKIAENELIKMPINKSMDLIGNILSGPTKLALYKSRIKVIEEADPKKIDQDYIEHVKRIFKRNPEFETNLLNEAMLSKNQRSNFLIHFPWDLKNKKHLNYLRQMIEYTYINQSEKLNDFIVSLERVKRAQPEEYSKAFPRDPLEVKKLFAWPALKSQKKVTGVTLSFEEVESLLQSTLRSLNFPGDFEIKEVRGARSNYLSIDTRGNLKITAYLQNARVPNSSSNSRFLAESVFQQKAILEKLAKNPELLDEHRPQAISDMIEAEWIGDPCKKEMIEALAN